MALDHLLAKPTIHLNGTGRDTLTSEYRDAIVAVDTAIRAVQDVTVHGRDYYVQPDIDAWRKANAQHLDRLKKLTEVRDELVAIYESIDATGVK